MLNIGITYSSVMIQEENDSIIALEMFHIRAQECCMAWCHKDTLDHSYEVHSIESHVPHAQSHL